MICALGSVKLIPREKGGNLALQALSPPPSCNFAALVCWWGEEHSPAHGLIPTLPSFTGTEAWKASIGSAPHGTPRCMSVTSGTHTQS